MKESIRFFTLIFSFALIYSFNFGETNVTLTKILGGTATLIVKTSVNGTTDGSDLTISDLSLACIPKFYTLTCISNIQLNLSTTGTEIQCSVEKTISTSASCVLYGDPSISSTGDSFNANTGGISAETSKFGNVQIELVSVEGKKTIIKLIPQKTGTTTTTNLFVTNLFVDNKALTCEAGQILKLEASSGTNMECSTSEEIDGNVLCQLSGQPKINSVGDSFDEISIKKNSVKSSFGLVKVGLFSAKGTTITINLKSEYNGNIYVDISGLEINGTSTLNCPSNYLDLTKEGVQHECTISNGVNEDDLCILTSTNLKSNALPKLEINEEEKSIIARNSKYGKVNISLKTVYGINIGLLIKTTFFGVTESNRFIIDGLKLHYDNTDYPLRCISSEKINFVEEGTDFTCTNPYNVIGGKECYLNGVATFNSERDTFSDITVSNNVAYSSFGKITIYLQSVIGKNVEISLSSEITGKTLSSIVSINNLKLNDKDLTCPIGININFSNRPSFICTLNEAMHGNVISELASDNAKIITPEDSNDIFGDIIINHISRTSSFGKLEISLVSVEGDIATIGLKSEYIGELDSLTINKIYVNGNGIYCSSGKKLILRDEEGNSDAEIQCSFNYYYSQQSNTSCTLLGNPYYYVSFFTSVFIGSNNTVISGIRNFGETILYLNSIKGTTVYIDIKPSIHGKVRPIISNLKLECGTEKYDVICNVADKKQLYSNSRTRIKCYMQSQINSNVVCRLINENVTITSDTEDIFGNVVISSDSISIRPSFSDFGNTEIKLTSIVGTQVNINIMVSSTSIYSSASPIIHGLYIGSSELYCVSTQTLYFTNNMAQMSCTSSSAITCTTCQLSGNPIIVTKESETATFGTTSLRAETVTKTSSTLGNVSIKLNQVVGNKVYIGVHSANSAKSSQRIDIDNLYVDGQRLHCSDDILLTSGDNQMVCTVEESIPYNKKVTLTGTPSIKIDSNEESVDVVQLTETNIEITSVSYSALCFELISVKENIAIISIIASNLDEKTLFTNFAVNGLSINNIPFEIDLSSVYLSNNAYNIKVRLNETIPRDTPCVINGLETARIVADNTTFGPFTSISNETISTGFKFGTGQISIIEVQGYSVILKIISSKNDYTKNTEINGLYINNNIPLICKLNDDIEFNENGTYVECQLSSPIKDGVYCYLSYKVDIDDNFETISIVSPSSVTSSYKYFGDVVIALKEVNGKNVKINVKTGKQNITTTNNVKINNLFANGNEITCQFDEKINFVIEGVDLNCKLETIGNSETYTLTGNNIEIISLADKFGTITIDEKNKTVRTSPKDIDGLTISLSSIAGDKASIKLSLSYYELELYTFIKISNLKIRRKDYYDNFDLSCSKVYIDLTKVNSFSDVIICTISSKLTNDLYFSLIDNSDEISIDSYDNFNNINIETNAVKSTKFGDIFINYVDSSIAINISSIYQGQTTSKININNLMLNSSLVLDCGTLDSVKISPQGTIVYCNLKEVKGTQGVNNKSPYISSYYDTYANIFLEKQSNINLKSANCYAFYNKTSCELNGNCIFDKETHGYCNYKYDYTNNNNTSGNDCILYLNQEECSKDEKCSWNEESKYICKNKQINNCKYLDKSNPNKCGECDSGYNLNNEGTQCKIYHCIDYVYERCISTSNCQYSNYFYYCSNKYETEEQSNCHLYLTQNLCNSQAKCSWKYIYSGCREKNINYCIKLKESNESLCEQCEEGYDLTGSNTCVKKIVYKNICENYNNNKAECLYNDYCEFSSRAYCYGGEDCNLILNRELCEERSSCHWNTNVDNMSRCNIRKIQNCLRLSSEDNNLCTKCENGYYLYNSNTLCKKYNTEEVTDDYDYIYHYEYCFQYGGEEKSCLNDKRCEFSDRNFCESAYNEYDYNIRCSKYLNKTDCENNEYCYWNTDSFKTCKIKIVEHCLEFGGEDNSLCLECESGYTLGDNSTECKKQSEEQFINSSLISLALIILILL